MENKPDRKTFTREELYELIWATPMTSIMKKYVVSRHGLQKICKEMCVPAPKSGYWEKFKVGKEVSTEKLPLDYNGKKELELLFREEGDNSKTGPLSELGLLQKEIESNPEIILTVPERLSNPDQILIQAKANIEAGKKQEYPSGPALGINVSPSNYNRTFIFLDALIKAIKARGHNVIVRDNVTYIVIEAEEIKIDFRNKHKRIELPTKYSWKEYDYDDTGIIIFRAQAFYYADMEWNDDKKTLEEKLSNIIAKLEIRERKVREKRAEINKNVRAWEEKEESIAKERWEFDNLLKQARRWKDAQLIRDFMKDFQIKAANDGNEEELAGWVKWANKMADWYDPSEGVEDDILGFYKENIQA